ncbi:MAG: prepilin-type N-terminal cleavage/methylation domain-containing protein [Gemmataceae bacterium]
MSHKLPRPGYTMIEMVIVLAIIIILGAILMGTLSGVEGDRPIKAAGDMLRARIAEARAKAMEDGISYRLSLSQDGRQISIAPDDPTKAMSQMSMTTADSNDPSSSDNVFPKGVTARVLSEEGAAPPIDQNGWTRIATFEPLGTCKETVVEVQLSQTGVYSLLVRMRGLTGSVKFIKQSQQSSGAPSKVSP